MVMAATSRIASRSSAPSTPRGGKLTRKLAAVAGAAGAAAIGGGEAQAVTYVPTAGIAAASGIPGFQFVDASNVTLGALRPPALNGSNNWDIDGSGTTNFNLVNNSTLAASFEGVQNVGSFYRSANNIKNLAQGSPVSAGLTGWGFARTVLTYRSSFSSSPPTFSPSTPGQFGLRFTDASNTYYGWASLTLDGTSRGEGFVITEAYYNTTPGAAINVGQVPVAVPEPSSMALLGLGAAGVVAWRARRKAAQAERSQAKVEA